MPRAFVLFNVESGLEDKVLGAVRRIEKVEEAYVSYGVYDLIVKVKTDSVEQLKEIVTHQLRTLDHVRSTLTLILVEE
jgi:DNA-binding Lrp family transcriptional regulator